ncbi:MAG: C-GCAxxG-C-C family protein [Nibricoccus sp.]
MKTLSASASAKFESGCNCSQAVLSAACGRLSLDCEQAMKMAGGFGGGRHDVCGALAGGILALSVRHVRTAKSPSPDAGALYAQVRDLVDRFQKRHGGVRCKELLGGCDLQTDAGKADFKKRGLKQATCACCVASVASSLEEIL